ncbi:hypothetical protein [Microvirga arabica]|uniref:hypothetical protein n=1 Tax=Microvirga arabica TaxID=1128671 RepID=UPI00193ACECF|nr:hypothetical protein [Microvirga arabica]MBM1173437.1 hypothetical protein [Microvirga arabica]
MLEPADELAIPTPADRERTARVRAFFDMAGAELGPDLGLLKGREQQRAEGTVKEDQSVRQHGRLESRASTIASR